MINWRKRLPPTRILTVLMVCALMPACASQTWNQPAIAPLENLPSYTVADVDILQVSPEMMEFLEAHIPSGMRGTDKAFTLAYAMLDPYLLGFRYDPAITLGAEDAFVQKSGNCLTFSSLFVAMARAAGLRAWYQEVKVPPNWSNINETLLVNLHVNAIVQ